jgi:hypothetical protein
MLMRMPRAPSIAPASSSGEAIARCAASTVRCSPGRGCRAHHCVAHARHDGLHVGKVAVDDARDSDDVGDSLHSLTKNVIGDAEGFEEARVLSDGQQFFVGDHDGGVDRLHEFGNAALRLLHAAFAFKGKRLGHHGDGERAHFAGQ